MFRNWVLQNFPFLENDFDALTDYELFCKMMEYVKNFAKDNEEFKKQLNEYENYFNNLDLQEEVNNKLDEMASDGTLDEIINQNIFNELNDKIDEIYGSTLLNVVNDLPEELKENNQYEEIKSEDNLENIVNYPISYYELSKNNIINTNENEDLDIIKVATWNIENENVPYNIAFNGIEKQNIIRSVLNKIGASIVGLNETFNGFLYPASLMYTNKFLSNVYFGKTSEGLTNYFYGNTTVSYKQASSSENIIFDSVDTTGEKRGFVKNVYSINGKVLSHYNIHLSNIEQTTKDQIDELFAIISEDINPYKIISGDFNFDLSLSANYLTDFINAGFKLVNGGQYKTYDDSRNIGIDEIMVSGNISILDSGVGNRDYIEETSDHFPLWATLSLGGSNENN